MKVRPPRSFEVDDPIEGWSDKTQVLIQRDLPEAPGCAQMLEALDVCVRQAGTRGQGLGKGVSRPLRSAAPDEGVAQPKLMRRIVERIHAPPLRLEQMFARQGVGRTVVGKYRAKQRDGFNRVKQRRLSPESARSMKILK